MESDEVAIIGAGLAGLTAGYYLKEQGIPFQIFEARNRAGGRAQTEYFASDSFEELGGKEISDGGEALCINQLANKLDCKITTLETDYDVVALISNIRQSLFEYDGLPNDKILENPGAYASLSDRLNMFIGKSTELRKLIETWINCFEGMDTIDISDHKGLQVLDWLTKRIKQGINRKSEGQKRKSRFFTYGTSNFIDKLSSGITENLHYSHTLESLEIKEDKVLLKFKGLKALSFSKVILTLPYPILRTIKIEENGEVRPLIQPGNEVVVTGRNTKILIPVKGEEKDPPFGITSSFTVWWNAPRDVLTVYFGGSNACIKLNNHEAQSKAFHEVWPVICQIYPHLNNHEIDFEDCKFKNWTEDDYSRGSYSFVAKNQEEIYEQLETCYSEKVRSIFSPYKNKVFYAGEHTSVTCPSTMEGAVESGKRVATIIKNIHLKQGLK